MVTRTGAEHYLPQLIARALRAATGADAGFAPPNWHAVQAPFDGALAALRPGPVGRLDVLRMFASPDMDPVVVELRRHELHAAARIQRELADPGNVAADELSWNWCRMPAGVSVGARDPATVAVVPGVVPTLGDWLDRELDATPAGVRAVDAIVDAL